MKFQYGSSCLKSISLNFLKTIFGITVFFVKIFRLPICSFAQGPPGGVPGGPGRGRPVLSTPPPSRDVFFGFRVPWGEGREGETESCFNTPRALTVSADSGSVFSNNLKGFAQSADPLIFRIFRIFIIFWIF